MPPTRSLRRFSTDSLTTQDPSAAPLFSSPLTRAPFVFAPPSRQPPIDRPLFILGRVLPLLTCIAWSGTLLLLFLIWLLPSFDAQKRYLPRVGALPDISHIGAAHKVVFALGNGATGGGYLGTVWVERGVRGMRGREEGAFKDERRWRILHAVDLCSASAAAVGLVLLAVFDRLEHRVLHALFTFTAMGGVALSALLETLEVTHLFHLHPDRHRLADSLLWRWFSLALCAFFGVGRGVFRFSCGGDALRDPWPLCWRVTTASAACEWLAAFSALGYLAVLVYDLWPEERYRVGAGEAERG
ncbi:hypothetical protein JCM6882_003883 [Rhodosporidiobolus microsporus]